MTKGVAFQNFKNSNWLGRKCSECVRVKIKKIILGLGMQIPEIPAQRKFVSPKCPAHSNAHKPPKTVAPTVLMLE